MTRPNDAVTFSSPQVNLFTADIARLQAFYGQLGFTQRLRYPADGPAQQVELDLDGFTLRLADAAATAQQHGLTGGLDGHGTALTLWCADVDAAHTRLTSNGARSLSGPRDWLGGLRTSWLADPDGNPIQLIQPAGSGPAAPNNPPTAAAQTSIQAPPTAGSQSATTAPAAPTSATTAGPTTATGAPTPAVEPSDDDLALPQSSLPPGYYTADGTPTFDAVAERIQQRVATADGNQVLDGESQRGRDETEELDRLKQAGNDRLEQLRKSMGGESL